MSEKDVVERAREWMAQDPSAADREELEALIAGDERDELEERMGADLEFGTAGLRGVVGGGRSRMNLANVIRTTRGLADYLLARVPDAKTLPVVLGRDGRLSSDEFMTATRQVLEGAMIPVRYFEQPVPTPIVAYAARQLSASAAVCITASHNPPEYNGYKVYAANAAQIVPPVDGEIAERIARVESASGVKRGGAGELSEVIGSALIERYFADLDALRPKLRVDRDFAIVYTPLHGVGGRFVMRGLEQTGFRKVHAVAEQFEPDGHFPTVKFPNPEEKGALDLSLELAKECDAELILANDPDADRLAVCVKTSSGRWLQLTGNQIGVLLADFMLAAAPTTPRRMVLSSIVSSPMLGEIAKRYDAYWDQTLTGFKWIWNAAMDLEAKGGVSYVFGFEEAIGYSAGHLVRDKDGISAAVLFAELVAALKSQGLSVVERLHQLYREHGLWVSTQKSITMPGSDGAQAIAAAMERLRSSPPTHVGEAEVMSVTDYQQGAADRPRWLASANLVAIELDTGRILVRPSGTEPKLKIYVDLRQPLDADQSVTAAEDDLTARATAVALQVAKLLELE
ncbi:MAG: phospho-sugar mutase [Polyangiaceae bacterium]